VFGAVGVCFVPLVFFFIARDAKPHMIMGIEDHVGGFRAASGADARGGVERALEGLLLAYEANPFLSAPNRIFILFFPELMHLLIRCTYDYLSERIPDKFQSRVFYDKRSFFVHFFIPSWCLLLYYNDSGYLNMRGAMVL
jgi:hypothetical protein